MNFLHKHLLSTWISNLQKEKVIFSLWKHSRTRVLGAAAQPGQADVSKSNHRTSIQTHLDSSAFEMHVFSWGECANYINSCVSKCCNASELQQLCRGTLSCTYLTEHSTGGTLPSDTARVTPSSRATWLQFCCHQWDSSSHRNDTSSSDRRQFTLGMAPLCH